MNPPSPPELPLVSDQATSEPSLLEGRDSRIQEFLRVMRIGREFVRGFQALHFVGPCVTFFGSARFGPETPWYEPSRRLAAKVGALGYNVMTGGGPGLMMAANHGAHDVGARSIGATIDIGREPPNRYVSQRIPFHYFFARKVILVKYSYGFVHLPGGVGTLDEMFEAVTLIQTGRVKEFPVVLYGTEYWAPLVDYLRTTLLAHGAIDKEDYDRFLLTDDDDQVLEALRHTARAHGLTLKPPPGAPAALR